ncbi:carboxylating nicotinate-nucleotide diphosphorylase [Geodermatophilus sp. YIM 151500]|uniref:carboxylating nicotinate-nucleotide diphosphorylase n=1 Tax=Geodermatophilus sp. YIM 151500 TaxID=2984531 RepID=UPI0021E46B50|nr:carboxylating nicotinate-nucleotide diphosphorylase [Geodermatophilus sp. YIM 151500]MCV2490896.1 carboxylating nicotinate-nucleotide diphosphorylase [Geodermatophilus sp. YIM 151500]
MTAAREETLPAEVADALRTGGLDPAGVRRIVRRALDEDLALGPDVTTLATVPARARASGDVVPRVPGVLAGVPVAAAVFALVGGSDVETVLRAADGAAAEPGRPALTVTGPTRALLTAERTALNLVGRLSGIATLTRAWVDAVAGSGAAIRDTRKTTPGLRVLEKYAVRCGAGVNHRMALGDAALVKDNHVLAAGGITAAVEAVRTTAPHVPLEVECDTLDQVREAVAVGVELVLLDNFSLDDTRAAVELVRGTGVRLEASGGLSLDRAAEVAATGVDYLAVGALTHSAPVLDLGFDLHA